MGTVHYLLPPMAKPEEETPNRIRFWRKLRGMTLLELGERVGLSKQAMGTIERGTRPLTLDRAAAIARELQVDIGHLLREADNPWMARDDIEREVLDAMRRGELVAGPVRETAAQLRAVADRVQSYDDGRKRA